MTKLSDFLGAISFLTVFGGARRLTKGSALAFPLVGLALGAVLGVGWWVLEQAFAPLVAATLIVGADAVFTGGLHLDGLADAADGLLSTASMERERRLEVMRDPRVGALGVVAVVVILLMRVVALSSVHLGVSQSAAVMAGIWCASRASMAMALRVMKYARTQGLAAALAEGKVSGGYLSGIWLVSAIAVIPLALLWVGLGNPLEAVVMVGAYLAAGALTLSLSEIRLGGYTGDVLGACGLVMETVALVVMSAAW